MKARTPLVRLFVTSLTNIPPKSVHLALSTPMMKCVTPVSKTKLLIGGVSCGLGAIGYHEISAAAHVPTASSLAYPLAGIMLHAATGLADISRVPKDDFYHPNRERLSDTPPHVSNVNISRHH